MPDLKHHARELIRRHAALTATLSTGPHSQQYKCAALDFDMECGQWAAQVAQAFLDAADLLDYHKEARMRALKGEK